MPGPPPSQIAWFALGGDAHTLRDARAAQGAVLRLGSYPRWFVGRPELVSEAEIARRRAEQGIEVLEAREESSGTPPGMRWRATVPVRPRRWTDVPLTQAGARLELSVSAGANESEWVLTLTLHAGERGLYREAEHRSTNVLPFLFGLEVHGRPLHLESACSAHFGGTVEFERLLKAGTSRRWTVRIDAAVIRKRAGSEAADAVGLVALFCERQHTGWAACPGEHPSPHSELGLPFDGEPVLIRSNAAAVPSGPGR